MTWCTAAFMGVQIFALMNDGLGHSFEITKLLQGFDRTVIEDFLNESKDWQDSICYPLMAAAFLFFMESIFIQSGLIACFEMHNYTLRNFVKNGLKYFLPFMAYAILFLILIVIIGGFFFFAFTQLIGQPIEDYDSEKPFFYSLLFMIVLFGLKVAGIWMWSLKTRYCYIKGHSFFKAIIEGLKSMYRHVGMTVSLSFVALSLFAFALTLQKCLNEYNTGQSWLAIAAAFIGLWLISLFRYAARSWIVYMCGKL